MTRSRRTEGTLGAELRGDTGASALSTLEPTPEFKTPPRSPTGSVCQSTNPDRCNVLIPVISIDPPKDPSAHIRNVGKQRAYSEDGKTFPFAILGSTL